MRRFCKKGETNITLNQFMEELTPKFNQPCEITDYESQMSFVENDTTIDMEKEFILDCGVEETQVNEQAVENPAEPELVNYAPAWKTNGLEAPRGSEWVGTNSTAVYTEE